MLVYAHFPPYPQDPTRVMGGLKVLALPLPCRLVVLFSHVPIWGIGQGSHGRAWIMSVCFDNTSLPVSRMMTAQCHKYWTCSHTELGNPTLPCKWLAKCLRHDIYMSSPLLLNIYGGNRFFLFRTAEPTLYARPGLWYLYLSPQNQLSVGWRSRPRGSRLSQLVYRYFPGGPKSNI